MTRNIPMTLAAIPAALMLVGTALANERTMDTVVVTASRTQELKRELSNNVTIIDEAEIKASPASTVAGLAQQHGLFVVTTGDTSNVQIRGYGNLSMSNEPENTVLTLVNGRRIGTANLGIMGLANVERIEIIRGPSAVQYGSSALGGVINIITKRGTEDKPYFSVEAGGGSDGLVREKLALGGAFSGFDLSLGLTNFSRQDVTTAEGGRWYHTDIDRNTTANLDLGYTFAENHRIGLSYHFGDTVSSLPTNNGGIRPFSQNTPSAFYNDYHKKFKNTAISYTGKTQDKVFDWSASYTTGREDNEYKAYGYTNFIENRTMNAQANYNGQMVSLSLGADALEYHHYESSATRKPKMADNGVYFSGKLRLLDERLIFSLGGRYDKYKNTTDEGASYSDDHFGGSYGLAWLPVEGLKLRANYAEGFKMPSPRQVGGSMWYAPNPDLKPEKSDTWEIGADLEWRALTASLTYFHSDYKNKIVGMSVMGMPRGYQFQNIKTATLAGVEGNLRADLGKAFAQPWSLSPYLGFTWLETRKSGDETQFITYNGSKINTLPNTPEWMFNYGVDFSHPGYKLKSRINAVTYGKLLTIDWSRGVFPAPYFERPSGTVVDLSVDKGIADWGKNTLTLRAEVNNLFDRANEMYWGYPGAGRSFYIGLRYDYQ